MAVAPGSNFGDSTIYRDNPNSSTDPGASNDTTQGFVPGSRWYNATTKILFMCLDNSSGAAVWQRITGLAPNQTGTVAGGGSTISGATAVTATGGALIVEGGAGSVGGALTLGGGAGSGGTNGLLILVRLPTADPSVTGALYGPSVAGALSISGG